MKKKFILSFCSIAILSLGLSSCKKTFLDTAPTDQVNKDIIVSTTANMAGVVNGIYRLMYTSYLNQDEGGESTVMIDGDMMGEDLVYPTTANGWFVTSYRYLMHRTVNATHLYFVYRYYYGLIGNANVVLANVDKATGPDADKNTIKAEALSIRAYSYFRLVQLFGKRYDGSVKGNNTQLGVPLVLTPDITPQPRATVEAVYTQINTDLDQAVILMGSTTRANKSHFDKSVIQGLKARVALTQQDYNTAANVAAQARASYTLMSNADYLAGFNSYTNTEWMWGIDQIPDQTTFFNSFFAYMSCNFNSTNIRTGPKCISKLLYDPISSTDIRKQVWDPTGANTAFPTPPGGVRFPYMHRKFLANSAGNSYGDLVFMRASEMYLIEAEAQAQLGNYAAAQTALFTLVKQRDPAYVKSTNTGAALITEILTQRRIELWGEGFRFFDLKRLNQALNRNGSNHVASVASIFDLPAGDPQWQYLIPQNEVNANPNIVQNP